ncbi:AEC family transporter [Paracoccus pacificus]|uniref:AEC family transporter n=1 Tax=Paracoccus pacificus TaxID=1463598 RepID=A0ABW4RCE9_9RHOB
MLPIFLKTLPFFAIIALGWFAARIRFFPPVATEWLTKFVFYFALSAMLFRFSAALDLTSLWDPAFVMAYLGGSLTVWLIGMAVARARGLSLPEMAMEAHCCVIGNTGFLGVPMLVVLLGPQAVGPVLMVLIVDLLVFSTLITLIISGSGRGPIGWRTVAPLLKGLVGNPMIISMAAGLVWAWLRLPLPDPLVEFLDLLGAAATPGALFAIGASLVARSASRIGPAIWLSFAKLTLHPLAVGIAAFGIFGVQPFAAGVMVAAAALPVAGNVYILAQHFNVAMQRVSTTILISTAASIVTIPFVIHWITGGLP